ncbi:MAG TPA: 5'-3' exonuclease H3TH domain-containing protein, partial [Vicinamibacteria bacterium]|nr:5'-3' exonuclease H3TH domain-containing protein [Vicinamibacteria bacterium]
MADIYIIDGSAQFHRAYFAIRGLTTSKGLPTNAVYGFTTMLRKLVQDEDPRYIGISFDIPGRTFRHEAYPAYKSHRPKMADDLAVQIPYVKRVCEALRVPIVEVPGYEADDVLATLAAEAVRKGFKVVLVSGDKDLLQLVSKDVVVLNPGREGSGATRYDAQKVVEKMGVPPEKVVDLLALMGDAVDNVPGVPGIGEKGARDLITEFGSLEGVLENVDSVKRATYREGLKTHREDALLSKILVTLRTDVPISLDLDALGRREPSRPEAYSLFTELEFVSLARDYAPEAARSENRHRLVEGDEDLSEVVSEARGSGRVALSVVAPSGDAMRAGLQGVALSVKPGESVFVPLGAEGQRGVRERLGDLLKDPSVQKLSVDLKRAQVILERAGLPLAGLAFDAVVVAYLLNPGRRTYTLEELSYEFLGERIRPLGITAPGDALDPAARLAGAEAELLLRLHEPVGARLREEGLAPIFDTMELPLIPVLARMERAGVRVDADLLRTMSRDMEGQLADLTHEIFALAGTEFNINSPVQLREILFDRLG